jgi:hypothetical protein
MNTFDQCTINNFGDIDIEELEHASHELASVAIAVALSEPDSPEFDVLFEHLTDHFKKLITEHQSKESVKDKSQSFH